MSNLNKHEKNVLDILRDDHYLLFSGVVRRTGLSEQDTAVTLQSLIMKDLVTTEQEDGETLYWHKPSFKFYSIIGA